eukprot:scaffold7945_cov67-Skeletonema_dohrnii-CCMP3373.AAC.1
MQVGHCELAVQRLKNYYLAQGMSSVGCHMRTPSKGGCLSLLRLLATESSCVSFVPCMPCEFMMCMSRFVSPGCSVISIYNARTGDETPPVAAKNS